MSEKVTNERPYGGIIAKLKTAGLRPTRQRIALAKLLFEPKEQHITAEDLHKEASSAGISVSLATVYNTLHQFTRKDLLREVVVEPGRSYFDTNTEDHHHFLNENTGCLEDIPSHQICVSALPSAPQGTKVRRVDVIVRVEEAAD